MEGKYGMQVWKPDPIKDRMFPFFYHTIKSNPDMWPLIGAVSFAVVAAGITGVWSCLKADVWINRSNKTPPWHWSRAKNLYNKRQKYLLDSADRWPRIPENDDLQEKMQEASMVRHGKSYDYLY